MKFLLYILSPFIAGLLLMLLVAILNSFGSRITTSSNISHILFGIILFSLIAFIRSIGKAPKKRDIENEWEQAQQAEQKYRNRPHKPTPHDT